MHLCGDYPNKHSKLDVLTNEGYLHSKESLQQSDIDQTSIRHQITYLTTIQPNYDKQLTLPIDLCPYNPYILENLIITAPSPILKKKKTMHTFYPSSFVNAL